MNIPTIMVNDIKMERVNGKMEVVDYTRPVEFFTRDDVLMCSDPILVDYYGEFRGNLPYIAPELEKWAQDNGGYWEWENAESISFTK